jgi:hypothetical protein
MHMPPMPKTKWQSVVIGNKRSAAQKLEDALRWRLRDTVRLYRNAHMELPPHIVKQCEAAGVEVEG